MQDNLKEIIRALWSKQLPFIAYRFPGEEEAKIVVQRETAVQTFSLDKIESVNGFVIAPFISASTNRAFLLYPNYIYNQFASLKEIEKLPSVKLADGSKPENKVWTKDAYLKKANDLIRDLKNNKLKKVVLSRVIEKNMATEIDPGQMYSMMNKKFHHSFNYIFYLPRVGSWMGATPEVFFRIKGDEAETVALAGTKHIDNINWTFKERHEQAIVTDFISYQLEQLGVANYTKSGQKTVKAGQLAHLSTKFSIPLAELESKTAKLIKLMQPTPAVC